MNTEKTTQEMLKSLTRKAHSVVDTVVKMRAEKVTDPKVLAVMSELMDLLKRTAKDMIPEKKVEDILVPSEQPVSG